ncbi:MAG TPA: ComEC/Rec2 family competence protein, partial [Candidatus Sumerlaeota bacterium]|nr:ComEC/Rec2 family competence protein [Candidatus Sumerlaeota bacterium]
YRVTGQVRSVDAPGNPVGFSLRAYLLEHHYTYAVRAHTLTLLPGRAPTPWPARWRETLQRRLAATMPGSYPDLYAQLLTSVLLGIHGAALPDEFTHQFRRAGIIHLMVVSGSQVALLSSFLLFPLWFIPRGRAGSTYPVLRVVMLALALPGLGLYLALADRLSGDAETPSGGTASAKTTGAGEASSTAAAPPNLTLHADFTIARAEAREAVLTDASGRVEMADGVARIFLDEGQVNGGPIRGDALLAMAGPEPRYEWNMAVEEARVESLVDSFAPRLKGRLTGTLDASSAGSARGSGEALKRQLQGEATFSIADGQIAGLELLELLARETRIPSFESFKFFSFEGDVHLRQGRAELDGVRIVGPSHALAIEGFYGLDGQLDLSIQPAVAADLIPLETKNEYLQALLAPGETGLTPLPLKFGIVGSTGNYSVRPEVALPASREQLGNTLRGIVGGALQDRLAGRGDPDDGEAGGEKRESLLPELPELPGLGGLTGRRDARRAIRAGDPSEPAPADETTGPAPASDEAPQETGAAETEPTPAPPEPSGDAEAPAQSRDEGDKAPAETPPPAPTPEPTPAPAAEPSPQPDPTAEPEVTPGPQAQPTPQPEAEPEPEPTPQPTPAEAPDEPAPPPAPENDDAATTG